MNSVERLMLAGLVKQAAVSEQEMVRDLIQSMKDEEGSLAYGHRHSPLSGKPDFLSVLGGVTGGALGASLGATKPNWAGIQKLNFKDNAQPAALGGVLGALLGYGTGALGSKAVRTMTAGLAHNDVRARAIDAVDVKNPEQVTGKQIARLLEQRSKEKQPAGVHRNPGLVGEPERL